MGFELQTFKIGANADKSEIEALNSVIKEASKIEILKNCDDKGNKFIEVFVFFKKGDDDV